MCKSILTISLLSIIVFLFSLDINAQGKGFQVILTTENDFLAINNADENYTGSLKIEAQFPEVAKWMPFFKYRTPGKSLTIQRAGIGGTAYTPQDLVSSEPVTNDRPYASLMFINFGNTSYNTESGAVLQSELVFGLVGTSLPGNAQSYIHEHRWFGTDRPIPMGWDNQIGYKGSLVINYNSKIEYPIFPGFDTGTNTSWLQLRVRGGADLGNYTANLKAGFKMNIVNLNAGLMQDYSPNILGASIRGLTNNISAIDKPVNYPKIRMNVFVTPEIRAVAYNTTLEGLMFSDHSVYKIPHNDITRVVFDISAGFNILLYDQYYFKYAMYGRSQEYSDGKNFHYWGGISLGYSPAKWNR
jgi:hypothetical protein